MKSGCRSCALAAASSSALGINLRKITHTSTSIWAMPVRSAAPIALRYSLSIRACAHTKLIRQIVLTVTWTELKSSNAATLVMLPAANQRQAPSSRSLGAVHDGHERFEFGRMQASRPDRNVLMELLRPASGDRLPDRVISVGFAVSAISLVYPRLRTYSGLLQTDTLGRKRSSRLPHILLVIPSTTSHSVGQHLVGAT
jgi:hypothetical protein